MSKLVTLLFTLAATGCATDAVLDDELETGDNTAGKADGSAPIYYRIRPDTACAAPPCSGLFARRLNFTTTRCANGSYAAECRVDELSSQALGLSASEAQMLATDVSLGRIIIAGALEPKRVGGRIRGHLIASEAWVAASEQDATGIFYRVKEAAVPCTGYPCAANHEAKLNTNVHRHVVGVDLDGAGASDEAIEQARMSMARADGAIVVGRHVTEPGTSMWTLLATQFYRRVVPAAPTACAGNTEIWSMQDLETFASTVTCVEGDLLIAPILDPAAPRLKLVLPLLQRVTGGFSMGGAILEELVVANLTSVGGNIEVSSASYPQPALTSVDLRGLVEFGGQRISMAGAPLLTPENVNLPDPAIRAKIAF